MLKKRVSPEAAAAFQSVLSGIEIPVEDSLEALLDNFQSVLSGIEILYLNCRKILPCSFNRSFLELKSRHSCAVFCRFPAFNRSFLELKYELQKLAPLINRDFQSVLSGIEIFGEGYGRYTHQRFQSVLSGIEISEVFQEYLDRRTLSIGPFWN